MAISVLSAKKVILSAACCLLAGQGMARAQDEVAADVAVKLQQTYVNGLLVMPLAGGKEAGQVTKMNLTALPSAGASGDPHFNQSVGDDMQKALREVKKHLHLRHHGWPVGNDIEIAFEEKYSGKDGPSAAVACGLLLESAISGVPLSLDMALTGDMNADGTVQPIGGVPAKIRGATKGSCKVVAIPKRNESSLADLMVMDGPAPLVNITVFSIATFDEALALASSQRSPELQQALSEFEMMKTVLLRDPRMMVPILRSAQAATRLQAILAKAPNCLSAKYLLLFSTGRAPATLSLPGSLEAALNSAESIVASINNDTGSGGSDSLKPDDLGGSLNQLRNLRPRANRKVWPYLDALVNYGEIIRGAILNPIRTGARFQDFRTKAMQAANAAKQAHSSLLADPEIRESMDL